MALELADAGCAVVVNVRSNRAEGEGVVQGDRGDGRPRHGRGRRRGRCAKAVNAMAEAALKKFGRIDYLVNNAALRQEKPIEDDDASRTGVSSPASSLDGAFHCVKACLEAIKKSDAGSIINIGGLTGAMGAPDRAHVVTAKAGHRRLHPRAGAWSLRPHKITVNTLVPAMLARPGKPNEIPAPPGIQAAARPAPAGRTISRR